MNNNVPLDRVKAAVRSSSDRPIPLPRRPLEEIPMSDDARPAAVTASRPGPTDADRAKAAAPADWKTAVGVRPHYAPCDFPDNPCSCGAAEDRYAIAAALAAAREEGRQSVGLGDFLPDPCGEEKAAPNWHFVESYGEWLPCSRHSGHDGDHEHEESGFTWPPAAAAPSPATRSTNEGNDRAH